MYAQGKIKPISGSLHFWYLSIVAYCVPYKRITETNDLWSVLCRKYFWGNIGTYLCDSYCWSQPGQFMELEYVLTNVLFVMYVYKPEENVSSTWFKSGEQKRSINCSTKMHCSPPTVNRNSDWCCAAYCRAEQSEVVMWIVT